MEIQGDAGVVLACCSSKAEEQKKRRQKGATWEMWRGVGRCGEIQGAEEAQAEGRHLGDVARCGEMGRCREQKKRRQKGATCLVGQLGTMQ